MPGASIVEFHQACPVAEDTGGLVQGHCSHASAGPVATPRIGIGPGGSVGSRRMASLIAPPETPISFAAARLLLDGAGRSMRSEHPLVGGEL